MRIIAAARQAGRDPQSIRLVAVSKSISADQIREAFSEGLTLFGENYVQEARQKIETLSTLPISWHFIGHLQSNKANYVVRHFDLIHSVDSLKLARSLNQSAQKIDKLQAILVQVNIAAEKSKFGTTADETVDLIGNISGLKNLSVKGLMTMPPYFNDPEKIRPFFLAVKELRDRISVELDLPLKELSMGMSGDFETAIHCGATLVRIGTAIFGVRN